MMTIEQFIAANSSIDWFSNCGKPDSNYKVIYSIIEAYDDWNDRYLRVWEPIISELEAEAINKMGDEQIDQVFTDISSAFGNSLWDKWSEFIERCDLDEETGLDHEMLDIVIRDLSWAFIEQALNRQGFFTNLLPVYRNGHFPCAWDGDYPTGQLVVL